MLQAIFLQVTRPSHAKCFMLNGIAAFCFSALIASCCIAQSPVSVSSDAGQYIVEEVQMSSDMDLGYATQGAELTSVFEEESSGSVIEVVKNYNLFGDPKGCCDEWAGFGRIKELSLEYGCGDCCKKSGSCIKRNAKKRRSVFTDAFRKCSQSKFSRSKCDRSKCGCLEETCLEEKGCTSCAK